MAKLPSGRAVAPGVDPIVPTAPSGQQRTQDAETLVQTPTDGPNPHTDAPVPTSLNETSPVFTKEDDARALPGNGASAEVEMISVKTKNQIVLMDPYSARHIGIKGAEVPVTSFINDELLEGGRLEKA